MQTIVAIRSRGVVRPVLALVLPPLQYDPR
jgi:hypothetical protein